MDKHLKKERANLSKVLISYMKDHKWSTFFYISFGVFWAFTLPYMSYLFGTIIDEIKNHGAQSTSVLKIVIVPLGMYVTIHVIRSIGYYAHGLFTLVSVPKYKKKLVKDLFAHLGKQSINYFEDKRSGSISNKITNACISLEPIIFNFSAIVFPQSLAIILTGILLSTVVPYFGIALWVWGIGIIYYTYRSAKIGNQKASVFAAACSQYNGHVVDTMTNIQTVIHHANMASETDLLDENMQHLIDSERDRNRHSNKVMFVQFIAMNALVAFFLVGSIMGYDRNMVSIGEVVFVMTAVTAIAGLTSSLGSTFLQLVYNLGLLREGLSLLDDSPDVPESENAVDHTIKYAEIEIKAISFAYPRLPLLFDNFNLTISPGKKIGIVGSSGSGKTSLIKLLMRLYDTKSGEINIDGINIKNYSKTSLRQQMAVVPQHLTLFHRSIFDNIAYGLKNVSKDDVIEASKKANCHDFIMSLERQYDTLIGEQGVKLSGGQRQRIAIARAILKNAPILLLDEATSALDSTTEQAIQDALESLLANKTALIIAHRLSTLKAMDKIIVVEKGKIIEMGTHQELLDKGGAYQKYWSHQSDGFIS